MAFVCLYSEPDEGWLFAWANGLTIQANGLTMTSYYVQAEFTTTT